VIKLEEIQEENNSNDSNTNDWDDDSDPLMGVFVGILFSIAIILILLILTGCAPVQQCPIVLCPTCPVCTNQTIEKTIYINSTIYDCNQTNASMIPTEINNTYLLGLFKQINRLEYNLEQYELQNTSTLCEDTIDDLDNCNLILNQTRELLD